MKKGFGFLVRVFGSKTKAQEVVLLLEGAKEVVRQGFYPEELGSVERFCSENCIFLVKSKFKILLADSEAYTNKGIRVEEKDTRGLYFVYLSKSEEKALMASYHELVDDTYNLGLVLGYPKCCVEFFCENFSEDKTNLELKPTNEWTNLSKREEDCVLISHFPCSSDCLRSIEIAKNNFEVLKKYDKGWAEEMLKELMF